MTGTHHDNGSPIHEVVSPIDTKSKIIITLVLVITIIIVITFEQLLFLMIVAFLLFITYRVHPTSLLKKSLIPLPLIVSLSILAYISYPEQGMLEFGGIIVAYNRWELTAFFFARSTLVVFVSLMLISSEPSFFEIIYALDELGLPSVITNILLLMYRSALDLQLEARRMIDARYSRNSGRMWGTNLYTYKVIGYMIGGILVRAFLKKDLRRDALYSRRFKGTLYHKSKPFRFNGLLLLWLIAILSITILLSTQTEFLPLGLRK